MRDTRTSSPELIELLRERSRTGYLNQIVNQPNSVKPNKGKIIAEEEDYETLIASVLGDD